MDNEGILYKMREDTFLATDLIAPFENRKIEDTEEEKDILRQEMMQALYTKYRLPY